MLRKWFELSSVVPLAVYVLIHAASYVGALFGARSFGEGSGSGVELVLEVCLVWAPLAFHVSYGFFLMATGGEPADTNRRDTEGEEAHRRRTLLLRASGLGALAFLAYHAYWLRGPILSGEQSSADTALRLAAGLSSLHWGVPIPAALHLLGLGVVCAHLAAGLARFFATFRVTSRTRAERLARVLSIALFAAGSATVIDLATGSALPNFVR